jgi:hypothetical protein
MILETPTTIFRNHFEHTVLAGPSYVKYVKANSPSSQETQVTRNLEISEFKNAS